MNQNNLFGLDGYFTTLFYLEFFGALIAIGFLGFISWLSFTWVMAYRDSVSNEIMTSRSRVQLSNARAAKCKAETRVIEHELEKLGVKAKVDGDTVSTADTSLRADQRL